MKLTIRTLIPLSLLAAASPLFAHKSEEHKLVGSDTSAGDFLGRSVSVHDLDVIAGAPGQSTLGALAGAAYIWSNDGSDFVEAAKLMASDGAAGDSFGRSVSIHHDAAIVGAPGSDVGALNSGAAYIFVRTGTVWSEEAKLVPSVATASGNFGAAVIINEETAIIGAPGARAAYVFTRTGTVWTQEAILTASDATLGNRFGISVVLRDDLAAIGADQQDGRGAAYVYSRSLGLWSEDQKLVAGDPNTGDLFGASIAMSEPVGASLTSKNIMVGAPGDDEAFLDAGAYYRFFDFGTSWGQAQKRLGLNPGDAMGVALATSNKFTTVGVRFFTNLGFVKTGTTIMYAIGNPALLQLFVASDPGTGNLMGNSVAMDGCTIVSGAVGDDQEGVDSGSVYIFAAVEGFATLVNGTGVNPVIQSTEVAPNIGEDWHIEVDTSTAFPTANLTIMYIYRGLLTTGMMLPVGELLLDLNTARIRQSVVAGSGLFTHEFMVPNDPFIVGLTAGAQTVILDTNAGMTLGLSNAESVMIGCQGGNHVE